MLKRERILAFASTECRKPFNRKQVPQGHKILPLVSRKQVAELSNGKCLQEMGGDIRRRTSFLALWVGILIRFWKRLSEQILHSSAKRRRNLSNDLASESKKEGPSFCKGRRLGF